MNEQTHAADELSAADRERFGVIIGALVAEDRAVLGQYLANMTAAQHATARDRFEELDRLRRVPGGGAEWMRKAQSVAEWLLLAVPVLNRRQRRAVRAHARRGGR